MQLQRKSYAGLVKTVSATQGIAEMFVSVFNVIDADNERVLPGFFKASLARKMPKGVWMHDWKQPVAKTLDARELAPGDSRLPDKIRSYGGLYVKGQFNLDTQRGREAFSDLTFGTVDEFSIGFTTEKSRAGDKAGVRDLVEGTLHEWSPVLVGACPETMLVGTKRAGAKSGPAPFDLNLARLRLRHSERTLRLLKGDAEEREHERLAYLAGRERELMLRHLRGF